MTQTLLSGAVASLLLWNSWAAAEDPAAAQRPLFDKLDADASGGLSLAEHLANLPEEHQKAARREFLVMDFDANGELSFAEYLALKGVAVPDPWQELAEAAFKIYQTIVQAADANGDAALSRSEWSKEAVQTKLPGFGAKTFSQWDANQDGQVVEQEARRMIDVGYGVCLPTGEPARWPNGSVLYWSHLREVDKNRDGIVSRAEFLAKHWLGKEKNEALFPELDRDGDGQLTYAEMHVREPFLVNLVTLFYSIDTDYDGRLSAAELAEKCPPAEKNPRGLDLGLTAFDEDGDGKYSLREFRLSPLGALYVTVPLLNCKDANQDGAVSFKEFSSKSSPLFAGIAGEVFRRYDLDHDGQLTHEEYDFPEDPELKQLAQQILPQVRGVLAAELHFFLTISPVPAEHRAALKPVVRQMQDKVLRQMATAQKQMNRGFDANRPPPIPDPQSLFAEQLFRFAQDKLPAEAAASYLKEVEQRETLRRQATVHSLVARMDRDLLLSDEQREKIGQALLDKWQPLWAQQIEFLIQNDQQMLALPEACVTPHLSELQKTVWQRVPKSAYFGWNFNGGVFQALGVDDNDGGLVRDLLPVLEAVEAPLEGVNIIEVEIER